MASYATFIERVKDIHKIVPYKVILMWIKRLLCQQKAVKQGLNNVLASKRAA